MEKAFSNSEGSGPCGGVMVGSVSFDLVRLGFAEGESVRPGGFFEAEAALDNGAPGTEAFCRACSSAMRELMAPDSRWEGAKGQRVLEFHEATSLPSLPGT